MLCYPVRMKPANGRCLIFCIFVFAAFTLSAAQGPIKPSSGKALCNALTPADFSKAGVPVSALSQANTDGNDGAYCVYKSSAGKVEFDIFYPAGANAAEVLATEKTVLGEGGSKYTPLKLAGADRAGALDTQHEAVELAQIFGLESACFEHRRTYTFAARTDLMTRSTMCAASIPSDSAA